MGEDISKRSVVRLALVYLSQRGKMSNSAGHACLARPTVKYFSRPIKYVAHSYSKAKRAGVDDRRAEVSFTADSRKAPDEEDGRSFAISRPSYH
jgi:hypothetical protein